MKKTEMVKILCQKYEYSPKFFEDKTYAEVKKILSYERKERKDQSEEDNADLLPNGTQWDSSNEDYI